MSDDLAVSLIAAFVTIALLGLFVMLALGGVLGEYGIDGPGYWHSVALAAVTRFAVMD